MRYLVRSTVAVLCVFVLSSSVADAQPNPEVVQVAAAKHVLVLLSDGTIVGWGSNYAGELAVAAPNVVKPPRRIVLPKKAVAIAAGDETSYAVLDDGTVMAWGRGYEGQLGPLRLSRDDRGTKVPVPHVVEGLRNVTAIVAEDHSALALCSDGRVFSWGGRMSGRDSLEPTPVAGLAGIVAITYRANRGFARGADGRVFGWGSNSHGGLGLGTEDKTTHPPTEIPALRGAVSIAAGDASAAVMSDGAVLTWGSNQQAGVGNGTRADTMDPGYPTPAPVKGVKRGVEVKRGSFGRHTIVRLENGTLVGWGNTDWGQLGIGISGDFHETPTAIKLPNVAAFWTDGNYTFARTKDGQLWFWGEQDGIRPVLGPTARNQKVPVAVPMEKLFAAQP